ncbi:MAG TPA: hypothetical protein VFG20_03595 [Planctomycetaceae bacterium]|jgi:hypothetical protein|nr:hypothetical protein [Planctomycetaceae bacterium]
MPAQKTTAFGLFLLFMTTVVHAEVESGPKVGDTVPALKVQAVNNGALADAADLVAKREDQETVYVFLPKSKFDRPVGRFVKALDTAMQKRQMLHPNLQIVLVWMTDDVTLGATRTNAIQTSLQLAASQWTVWKDEATSPEGWVISDKAAVSVIVVHKKKVQATFGYDSVNDTVVPTIDAAVAKVAP